MIFDVFGLLFAALLWTIVFVLGAITGWIGVVVPPQVNTAWSELLSYAGMLRGVFPIDTGINVVLFLLSVYVLKYVVSAFLMLFKMLPMFKNSNAELPSHR